MLLVHGHLILLTRHQGTVFATEALCRHMRWPLAWGGKIKDECITCPLHQTTHHLDTGELVSWSPFPLFPPYGKLVGKLSRQKNLTVYDVCEKEDHIFVQFSSLDESAASDS